jgi:hypothetical protein
MVLLVAATTLAAALYAAACWLLPFGRCWFCRGVGARPRLITRRLRPCRMCRGAGRRLRYGRRAFNYFARIHRDATHNRTARRATAR